MTVMLFHFANYVSVWGHISFSYMSSKTTDCNRLNTETSVWIQLHPVKLDVKELWKHTMPLFSLFLGDGYSYFSRETHYYMLTCSILLLFRNTYYVKYLFNFSYCKYQNTEGKQTKAFVRSLAIFQSIKRPWDTTLVGYPSGRKPRKR